MRFVRENQDGTSNPTSLSEPTPVTWSARRSLGNVVTLTTDGRCQLATQPRSPPGQAHRPDGIAPGQRGDVPKRIETDKLAIAMMTSRGKRCAKV